MTLTTLKAPYLILLGSEQRPAYAKTGLGLAQWCPDKVLGQLRFADCLIDLGVPELTIGEAIEQGAGSLVIGVAPVGGSLPDSWLLVIEQAAKQGLDIVCGLHLKLTDYPEIVAAAEQSGARLINVRTPPDKIPVGLGSKRKGKRLLTVGTDCASGKKYTALALDRALQEAGINSSFCATGQTGIMISGKGIPIDSVVADFIAGAAEVVSPDNDENHWDIIEGQGSLFHPGYSGVSLGLLHGSQPDAFIVCHDASRTHVASWEDFPLPTIQECIDLHLQLGKRTNPNICCIGVSVNTSGLAETKRAAYLASLSEVTGLPCIDPLVDGCDVLVEQIKQQYGL